MSVLKETRLCLRSFSLVPLTVCVCGCYCITHLRAVTPSNSQPTFHVKHFGPCTVSRRTLNGTIFVVDTIFTTVAALVSSSQYVPRRSCGSGCLGVALVVGSLAPFCTLEAPASLFHHLFSFLDPNRKLSSFSDLWHCRTCTCVSPSSWRRTMEGKEKVKV